MPKYARFIKDGYVVPFQSVHEGDDKFEIFESKPEDVVTDKKFLEPTPDPEDKNGLASAVEAAIKDKAIKDKAEAKEHAAKEKALIASAAVRSSKSK